MFPKPIGIISCGGLSSRMKKDKSLLEYHGKPHRYYLYELIKPFCEQVFISCNKDQADGVDDEYNFIVDKYLFENHGPVSGLLSCYSDFPNDSFLFIGCDYPNISLEDIKLLVESRNEQSNAVCYKNKLTGIAEPLITIYENNACKIILENFFEEQFSLMKFLETDSTNFLSTKNKDLFISIDTPEQYANQLRIKN